MSKTTHFQSASSTNKPLLLKNQLSGRKRNSELSNLIRDSSFFQGNQDHQNHMNSRLRSNVEMDDNQNNDFDDSPDGSEDNVFGARSNKKSAVKLMTKEEAMNRSTPLVMMSDASVKRCSQKVPLKISTLGNSLPLSFMKHLQPYLSSHGISAGSFKNNKSVMQRLVMKAIDQEISSVIKSLPANHETDCPSFYFREMVFQATEAFQKTMMN